MINFAAFTQLLSAAGTSLVIALLASVGGSIAGTLLALVQTSGSRALSTAVSVFVTVIRGTPMLFQIMFLYLFLPILGIVLSPFMTAVLAIGMNSSAYVSQIVRAGIKAVAVGQIEAARTLGVSANDIIQSIVLPQAVKVVFPALGNEMVTLLKDTALASVIGVHELYLQTNIIQSRTYDALGAFLAAGLIYLAMTTTLTLIFNKIETHLSGYIRK